MTDGPTLVLDGSTYAGSVAVFRDGAVAASRELEDSPVPGRGGRPESFLPMVADCLSDARVQPLGLQHVVCGAGPGSFTSLRVAASIAKGIATGAGCPLFAVSSLALIVADRKAGRYLATLPAMRGELFTGLFDVAADGRVDELRAPSIIVESAAAAEAKKAGAVIVSEKPHARCVERILSAVIAAGECDIDTWEPAYGRLAEAQVRWEAAHGRPLTQAR